MKKFALMAIAGAASSVVAQPLFIFEQSTGTFDVVAEDANTRTIAFETSVTFEVGGLGVTTIDGQFVQTFTGGNEDTFAGSAVFTGASNADTISVDFAGTLFDDRFASLAGRWTLTGSTGAYAQYTSGGGDNSASYFFVTDDSGTFVSVFQGLLVPAPGGLALAGLGVAFAARRRRA
jgi:hypothetical protein